MWLSVAGRMTLRATLSPQHREKTVIPSAPIPAPAATTVRTTGAGRARRARDRTWRQLAVPVPAGAYDQLSGLRRLARTNLIAWGVRTEQAEEIELVLGELASNALCHTSGPARIRLHIRHRVVFLQVSDTSEKPGRGDGPYLEADWPHGLGVLIADQLADRGSTRIHPGLGKTVTAEFDVD